MADHIIIAPHPDDEVVGCYEILMNTEKKIIIYTGQSSNERKEEALKLKDKIDNIKAVFFNQSIPAHLLKPENVYYYPDPTTEIHPDHRMQGTIGESMLRQALNVIFYSTIMNAPYIHELYDESAKKEELLNEIYPSQKSLWEFEKKFVLFEGRCKWLM